MKRNLCAWIASVLLCCGWHAVWASSLPVGYLKAQTIAGLGTATFPTSAASAEAQTAFMRGLLWLHVFEYPQAAEAFREAEKLDPDFAMAYWGEAMTFNHPVWNQFDGDAGRAALLKFGATAQARAAKIADARERGYMAAVELLYDGQGSKRQHDERYLKAMEALAKAYPKDDEAQMFWSLALLGENEGVRDVPVFLRAAEIAKAAFARNTDHPGAAHYWIHGMDDPEHAAGALVAANALSKIAPEAGHAQHMCSHIFMALGMWDAVIASNEQANRVVDSSAVRRGRPVVECGHYVEWLQYAYYQQGRRKEGDGLLNACEQTSKAGMQMRQEHFMPGMSMAQAAKMMAGDLVDMRAVAVIETGDWDGAAAKRLIDTSSLGAEAAADAFTTGYAAAARGDRPAAEAALAVMHAAAHPADAAQAPDKEQAGYDRVMEAELEALIAKASDDLPKAVVIMQRAAGEYAAMPFSFGPPVTVKPPHELLGELLLAEGDGVKAAEAFRMSLKFAPRRSLSLLGLMRAEEKAGHKAEAAAARKMLQENWRKADAGVVQTMLAGRS